MSSGAVLRFKNELRTTIELMELMDVLKQVAASQFQGLEEKRFKAGVRQFSLPARHEEDAKPPAPQDRPQSATPEPKATASIPAPARSGRTSLALHLRGVIEDCFRLIPPDQCRHPFLEVPGADSFSSGGSRRLGLVIVTFDEGFLGGLDGLVVRNALLTPGAERAELTVVGERGRAMLAERHRAFTYFPWVSSQIEAVSVERLRDHLTAQYLSLALGRIIMFYPRFVSFVQQETASFRLLPYQPPLSPAGEGRAAEVILEPSAAQIIEYLVGLLLASEIEEMFWLSRRAELAARIMHLEATGRKLVEMKNKLRLQYFRVKHEVTDTSIRETYAGLLLKKKKK